VDLDNNFKCDCLNMEMKQTCTILTDKSRDCFRVGSKVTFMSFTINNWI